MSIVPYQNGNYPVKKDEILFVEGENPSSINILSKGKADVYISALEKTEGAKEEDILKQSYRIFSVGQNTFLGVDSLFVNSNYHFTYKAGEDGSVYVLMIQKPEQIKSLMKSKTEYISFIFSSISILVEHCYVMLARQEKIAKRIHCAAANLSILFWKYKERFSFNYSPKMPDIFTKAREAYAEIKEKGGIPDSFSTDFIDGNKSGFSEDTFDSSIQYDSKKIDYFRRISKLSTQIKKALLTADLTLASYFCEDAASLLDDLVVQIKNAFAEVKDAYSLLYKDGQDCVFSAYISALKETSAKGIPTSDLTEAIDFLLNRMKSVSDVYEKDYFHKTEIDFDYLRVVYDEAKAPPVATSSDNLTDIEGSEVLPAELENSVSKIIAYSEIPKERADIFMKNLNAFRAMNNKFDTESDARKIRKGMTGVFFEIYEAVFKKYFSQGAKGNRLIDMFLQYSYMDETLLDKKHVLDLYKLKDNTKSVDEEIGVYNMREWLTEVYEQNKAPSINGFGQTYEELFREMKKRGEITDAEKEAYMEDIERKLHGEVSEFFANNQRTSYGQISVYAPVLHNDMIMRDVEQSLLTKEKVSEAVRNILEVDFSAFHREVLFRDPEKGVDKELIMQRVIPDYILIPTFGSRATMWQELSTRSKTSKGRIVLPILTTEDLEAFIQTTTANFRWELCKTMLGHAWQDISTNSLTADYSDYVQFYRKNRDLSSEAKEKLKSQISKARNDTRSVFAMDYSFWISYEAKGNIRLNKVSRNILYRHCPFSKDIREQVSKLPMFAETANRFKNIRARQVRDIENHYHKYTKVGEELPKEMLDHIAFYKDM